MTAPSEMLARNLRALGRVDADLARRLLETEPAELAWAATAKGVRTASLQHDGRPLQLASRFDPLAEAENLAATVDHRKHACVVVLGMGLGYHVQQIAKHMGDNAVLLVHEPDLALLRAVLEQVDHSGWLGRVHAILAAGEVDRAWLMNRVDPYAGVVTQGTIIVGHPPSRLRHSEAHAHFSQAFTEVLGYCRTNVATALVNASRTVRNLMSNIALYAAGETTDALHRAAAGYPAVCVGAGPSLARNLDLLQDPKLRAGVVLITAQTTLKVLLKHGIKPDFVTALDYAEISRRFYEGLPALPEVTLVAEPKAHPSILESFPGPVRTTGNQFLDKLLGDNLTRKRIAIRSGATVAHLSFYLAQHLGCDPIILIGQDLGFADGLYYCPGTAIHEVWAPELGAFNTLEMMEWQRIARHRSHLSKAQDVHGRTIYTDEQMLTYLKQFERDFATASQTIIDATEGGLPKAHTVAMPLAQALSQHVSGPVPKLPPPSQALDAQRVGDLLRLMRERLDEVRQLRKCATGAEPIILQMLEHQKDQRRIEELFVRLKKIQDRVDELDVTFDLINQLNTIGTFKRARMDRDIYHNTQDDPLTRQRKQLERDLDNMRWLTQACDEAITTFEQSLERVRLKTQAKEASGQVEPKCAG